MRIVLGLGNPGRRYDQTRHNVGFRVADRLASRLGVRLRPGAAGDEVDFAAASIGGERVVIAKPQTFMNRSGTAAARLSALYGSAPADFIVAYDDVALPLGSLRVRPSGSSAGQKGMASILASLGTNDVPRVRLGILGDRGDADLADYVLEPFTANEQTAAEDMIERACEAVMTVVTSGILEAMNRFNRKDSAPS